MTTALKDTGRLWTGVSNFADYYNHIVLSKLSWHTVPEKECHRHS